MFDGEVQEPSNVEEEQAPTDIDGAVFRAGNRNEDIEFVRNQGLVVDDDNEPAPENIPQEQVTFSRLFDGQSWGYNGIDRRATSVPVDQEPSFQGGWTTGIFTTAMSLTTTTTSGILSQVLKTLGGLIVGQLGCLLSCLHCQR